MSSTLAIAASTLALRNRVQAALDRDGLNAIVTGRPLDRARSNQTGNQLNLFLYELGVSAAWRNDALPRHVPGGAGVALAPLGLSARYLLCAYAQDDEEELSHRLLASAMLSLHDQALLTPDELRAALPASDLGAQREHVRITPHPLGLDELSKLWTTFQAPYRATVAYEITPLLIDSRQPEHAPLPVAQRPLRPPVYQPLGNPVPVDSGVGVSAAPGPLLVDVLPPAPLTAVRPGETLTWQIEHSAALSAAPQLRSVLSEFRELPPLTRADARSPFTLLVLPDWPAGVYQAALTVQAADGTVTTAPLMVTLAPAITVSPTSAPAGPVTLTVACQPAVTAAQSALLLIGGLILAPGSRAPDGRQLSFAVPALPAGRYTTRLRVDGVDSLPVALVDATHPYRPDFDPAQQLELT